jgi:hypothetical protein
MSEKNLYKVWYVYHDTWTHLNSYFINPSHQSVCVYVYPPIVARQRVGIQIPVVPNAWNKELLDASFSMRSVS